MNTPTAHYHPTSVTVENHSHPITGRAGFIVLDRSQFAEGVIYNSFWTTNYNEATGLMLSEMDYSICIRNERNFCGVQYTACADQGNLDCLHSPTFVCD